MLITDTYPKLLSESSVYQLHLSQSQNFVALQPEYYVLQQWQNILLYIFKMVVD